MKNNTENEKTLEELKLECQASIDSLVETGVIDSNQAEELSESLIRVCSLKTGKREMMDIFLEISKSDVADNNTVKKNRI